MRSEICRCVDRLFGSGEFEHFAAQRDDTRQIAILGEILTKCKNKAIVRGGLLGRLVALSAKGLLILDGGDPHLTKLRNCYPMYLASQKQD